MSHSLLEQIPLIHCLDHFSGQRTFWHKICRFSGEAVTGGLSMATDSSAPIRVFLITSQRCVLWGLERLIETQRPAMQVAGSACSCADAFDRISNAAPDLIVLDVDSGNEDGLAAIAELKARVRARILVWTGSRRETLHDDAVLAGANGVVRKESPAETILSAIRKVHSGELWLDRATLGRIFGELSKLRSQPEGGPDHAKIAKLTARERQIVAFTADHPGMNGKALAQMLGVSQHTLRNHLTSIYEKLDVPGRVAMYAFVQKHRSTLATPAPDRISRASMTPHSPGGSANALSISLNGEIDQGGREMVLQRANGTGLST